VCLIPAGRQLDRSEVKRVIYMLVAELRFDNMRSIMPVTKAIVPVLKFVDPMTGLQCDLSFGNTNGLVNTDLLRVYASLDARVRPLVLAVKNWAAQRKINDPAAQTLSSYAYVLLVIAYLQRTTPPVLPCLQEVGRTPRAEPPPLHDASFCIDVALALRALDPGPRNKQRVDELLRGFFCEYATVFDPALDVVCVRLGGWVKREAKKWWTTADERHLLCIEDPFILDHDLGRVLTRRTQPRVLAEIRRAHELCTAANPAVSYGALCAPPGPPNAVR